MALQARKDGDMRNIERRAVNARYLAELVKFRSMPFGAFFVLLKVCAVVYISIESACMLASGAHPGSRNFSTNLFELPQQDVCIVKLQGSQDYSRHQANLQADRPLPFCLFTCWGIKITSPDHTQWACPACSGLVLRSKLQRSVLYLMFSAVLLLYQTFGSSIMLRQPQGCPFVPRASNARGRDTVADGPPRGSVWHLICTPEFYWRDQTVAVLCELKMLTARNKSAVLGCPQMVLPLDSFEAD